MCPICDGKMLHQEGKKFCPDCDVVWCGRGAGARRGLKREREWLTRTIEDGVEVSPLVLAVPRARLIEVRNEIDELRVLIKGLVQGITGGAVEIDVLVRAEKYIEGLTAEAAGDRK